MIEEIDGRDIVIECLKRRIKRLEDETKRLKREREELTRILLKGMNEPDIIYITWPALPSYPPAWPEYPSPYRPMC